MYKEAVQKMPRQFAPQSLYNMMGQCLLFSAFRYFYLRFINTYTAI